MARIAEDEYRLAEMPSGDVFDFDAPASRVKTDPMERIHPAVRELVEGAYKAGKLRVKVISGYASHDDAVTAASKIVRQARKYGEIRPDGRITVGATVVENFVRPDGKGTVPVVVTMVAKDYKPRAPKATKAAEAK